MYRKSLPILGALAATVALAACSTSSEPVAAPETPAPAAEAPAPSDGGADAEEAEEIDPDAYTMDERWGAWTYGGAEVIIEFSVDPSDPRVAAAEELREASAAEPVFYSIASVDNRMGSNYVGANLTRIYDAEGTEFSLVPAADYAEEAWGSQTEWTSDYEDYKNVNAAGEELSDEEHQALSELYLDTDLGDGVDPGGKEEMILVSEEELPTAASTISIEAEGMEPSYASPESYMPSFEEVFGEDG